MTTERMAPRVPELLAPDRFPRWSRYDPAWILDNEMGPYVLWLTEFLSEGMDLKAGMRVLDLGCGTALSSIFLAREFDVEVWATDLWIAAEDNEPRVRKAGVGEQVHVVHADARALPFEPDFFDAIAHPMKQEDESKARRIAEQSKQARSDRKLLSARQLALVELQASRRDRCLRRSTAPGDGDALRSLGQPPVRQAQMRPAVSSVF